MMIAEDAVEWLCLLGSLTDQVGQRRDFMLSEYAILKILPERHAQLAAGLLQADKGIAAASARFDLLPESMKNLVGLCQRGPG